MGSDTRTTPPLEARAASHRYGSRGFELAATSLTFAPGSFTTVLGSNGSGKSTLVRMLGGLVQPTRGAVFLGGVELADVPSRDRSRILAFLSQDEPRRIPFTVSEVVMMGRFPHQGAWPFDSSLDLDAAREAMTKADVIDLASRAVAELSGGERQRVYLARALAQNPRILLLDEPASSLDLSHQVELYRFLQQLHREEGLTIIAVSHELNLATKFCDQVVLLKPGRVAHVGDPGELLTETVLSDVFDVGVRAFEDPKSGDRVFVPNCE